jgi:hypothetical protein
VLNTISFFVLGLKDLFERKVVYIATLNISREVGVKFTSCYNEAAHHILANAQLAPELHFCGRIIGNLYMVVMDRVDGKSLWQLQ